MLNEQLVQTIGQGLSAGPQFGRQFRHVQRGDGCVLVAAVLSRQVPQRFFGAEHKQIGAPLVDDLADEFETDQQILHDVDLVGSSNLSHERRCDQRLNDIVIAGQGTSVCTLAQDIICQQRPHTG